MSNTDTIPGRSFYNHSDYKVGDEIAIQPRGRYPRTHCYGKIVKITKSGQVTVEIPMGDTTRSERFNAHGYEMGGYGSKYNKAMLYDPVRARYYDEQLRASTNREASRNEFRKELDSVAQSYYLFDKKDEFTKKLRELADKLETLS